jgi:hypothetical protein
MSKISQIVEGWKNNLTPSQYLHTDIIKVAKERMSICNSCEEHSSNKKDYKTIRPDAHCTNCGCTLAAKTKCLTCECPLRKWMSAQTLTDNETT